MPSHKLHHLSHARHDASSPLAEHNAPDAHECHRVATAIQGMPMPSSVVCSQGMMEQYTHMFTVVQGVPRCRVLSGSHSPGPLSGGHFGLQRHPASWPHCHRSANAGAFDSSGCGIYLMLPKLLCMHGCRVEGLWRCPPSPNQPSPLFFRLTPPESVCRTVRQCTHHFDLCFQADSCHTCKPPPF